MKVQRAQSTVLTNDEIIRPALRGYIESMRSKDHDFRIIEELGVHHGTARIDMAVVNGVVHGYEIKSDLDTLQRLPEQMEIYNSVFNYVTLVVGKSHLHAAINMIPDWWGVMVVKHNLVDGSIILNAIREAERNQGQRGISIARLLWKGEALKILEDLHQANGVRSKTADVIYQKLAEITDQKTLEDKVRRVLCFRPNWRVDQQLVLSGD